MLPSSVKQIAGIEVSVCFPEERRVSIFFSKKKPETVSNLFFRISCFRIAYLVTHDLPSIRI